MSLVNTNVQAPNEEHAPAARREKDAPWQLRMFSKSLKKRQKLALLLRQIGETSGKHCLLVTNGDNNGALNWHFRVRGGRWVWVELEEEHIPEMEQLLCDEVRRGSPSRIPVDDAACDLVVSIDVHEHLHDCHAYNSELKRVTKPGGAVVVTTPNGDAWKPMTIFKTLLGMTKEKYGHVVTGYNIRQHEVMLSSVGLAPIESGSYSKFFTELVELANNLAYLRLRSRKSERKIAPGNIAPVTALQFQSVGGTYRIYSAVYPILWLITRLDVLLFFCTGYAVSVSSRRPHE